MMRLNINLLRVILAMALAVTDAHTDDHWNSKDGYTFVIDDLMWLVILIVGATLIVWLCCCMDPMFDTTSMYGYRQCTPTTTTPSCDPVIRVKICADDARRACRQQTKTSANRPLSPIKSFDTGDPHAVPGPEVESPR